MQRRAVGLLLLLFGAAACTRTDVLEVRFSSTAIESITNDVRVFVFSGPDVGCSRVDPRGLGPGDAPERTGLEPDFFATAPPSEALFADFSGVSTGPATVVVEAWGLPCTDIGGSAETPVCNRLSPNGTPVLRGYFCGDLELSAGERIDLTADLETFALIGSTLAVPTSFPSSAVHYDDENPLFVTDGLIGRDRFTVQVLNHLAEAENDVLVRFEVVEGDGRLVDPQPLATAADPAIQDDGLASTTLQAGLHASGMNGGRILVRAHAPGYEGSPIELVARAVPPVQIDLETVPIPRQQVDLSRTSGDSHPIVAEDLDGDGRVDLATIAGFSEHTLILAYALAGGGWSVHVSDPIPGQVRAMTTAALAPGQRVLLLAVADSAATLGPTPFGSTYIIQNPRLEAHAGLEIRPSGPTFTTSPTILSEESDAAMEKVAVDMHAADIDGDGTDELALSRCSYVYAVNASQAPNVLCNARLSDKTDSELALLRVMPGPTLQKAASLQSEGNDGGFRGVRLVDIDGDGSLDLASAASSIAVGVCGRAGMPQSGFGFNDAPRFFTTITFGQGWSLAPGRFNDDDFTDLLITGAVRSSSPNAGLKLVPGGPCQFSDGPNPLIVGPKTNARYLVVRTADLNRDGWSDAVLLHRSEREMQIYLGGGRFGLAAGPVVRLPFSTSAEMDLELEPGQAVLGAVAPAENALVVARVRPSRPPP